MATVTLPGVGTVDRKYVYAGGALVAGIVGYAWFKHSTTQSADLGATADSTADATDTGVTEAGDYVDPTFGGVSSMPVSSSQVDNTIIDTNGEWTAAAVEAMSNLGYDGIATSTALGKYLARKGLSASEADYVTTARGLVGDPPVGGPYSVIYNPGGTTTTTPATTYTGPAKVIGGARFVKANHTNFEAELLQHYTNVAPPGTERALQVSKLETRNAAHGGIQHHPTGSIYLPATI